MAFLKFSALALLALRVASVFAVDVDVSILDLVVQARTVVVACRLPQGGN